MGIGSGSGAHLTAVCMVWKENVQKDYCLVLLFAVTIPYPLVETDCYSVTSSDQLYVANPGCYDDCILVPSCATPLNEITCVTPIICECYNVSRILQSKCVGSEEKKSHVFVVQSSLCLYTCTKCSIVLLNVCHYCAQSKAV